MLKETKQNFIMQYPMSIEPVKMLSTSNQLLLQNIFTASVTKLIPDHNNSHFQLLSGANKIVSGLTNQNEYTKLLWQITVFAGR